MKDIDKDCIIKLINKAEVVTIMARNPRLSNFIETLDNSGITSEYTITIMKQLTQESYSEFLINKGLFSPTGIKSVIKQQEAKEIEQKTKEDNEASAENDSLAYLDEEEDVELDDLLDSLEFKDLLDKSTEITNHKDNLIYLQELHSEKNKIKEDHYSEVQKQTLSNLITANKRLVLKIVQKYSGLATLGYDKNDMIQDGTMGLIKAANRFEIEKGFEFSTYATWWIRQSITRGIMDSSLTIRLPVHLREQINKINRIEQESIVNLCMVSNQYVIEKADISLDKYKEIIKIRNTFISTGSLDTPIGMDEDTTIGAMIKDEHVNVSEEIMNQELRTIFENLMDTLTDREKAVVRLRFGWEDGKKYTLEEIGEVFDVTRERIRQIEAKSLKKLSKPKNKKILEDFMNR